MHQANVAFRNHLGNRQAIAAIAHGDLGHEAEVTGNELLGGAGIGVLLVALGQHVFFIRFQHGELADFLKIAAQAPFGGEDGQIGLGHVCTPFWFPRIPRADIRLPMAWPAHR
ncbi:hypothetical protein D9M68_838780 [compost metagenome]